MKDEKIRRLLTNINHCKLITKEIFKTKKHNFNFIVYNFYSSYFIFSLKKKLRKTIETSAKPGQKSRPVVVTTEMLFGLGDDGKTQHI